MDLAEDYGAVLERLHPVNEPVRACSGGVVVVEAINGGFSDVSREIVCYYALEGGREQASESQVLGDDWFVFSVPWR